MVGQIVATALGGCEDNGLIHRCIAQDVIK
jgi:hypothetical protein